MAYGAGGGNLPAKHGMLASEADREATQAVLKQAFEEQRLTQDEFEARLGQAMAARTQNELAGLTRDLPLPSAPPQPFTARPARKTRRAWLLAGGAAAIVIAVAVVLSQALSSGRSAPAITLPPSPRESTAPAPSGPAGCPVGTSQTALTIAIALAGNPVYSDPGSSLLTAAQRRRLRALIGRDDPGRIRIAAVTPSTVRKGGGERALTNAIAGCSDDSLGTTVLTTTSATYLVTSYINSNAATRAVGAALNSHGSLSSGLVDAVGRIAIVDRSNH